MRSRPGRRHGRVLIQVAGALILLGAAGALARPAAPATAGGVCDGRPLVAARVSVLEAPLSVRSDFGLADLRAMASRLSQVPAHPVLGFYLGTVGYRLRVAASDVRCPLVTVQAQLVAVERRIEVGSELRDRPCELSAAVAHYRRHAAADSAALRALAADLGRQLEREVGRALRDHPLRSGQDLASLRGRIGSVLDASLAAFNRSLTTVQAAVDTPGEVRALGAGCTSL